MQRQFAHGVSEGLPYAVAALALGLLLGIPALAGEDVVFNFKTIDVPSSTRTAVNANSTHSIAGEFDDTNKTPKTHGFVLSGGAYRTIDVPGASSTVINGISANGQLAGTYQIEKNGVVTTHAFFWSQGVFTTLDPPYSVRSQGGFLNARGQVVGVYRTADAIRHGFLWRKGVFESFNVPGDNPVLNTVAFGINDLGQIVGDYFIDVNGNYHGFLLSQGDYTTLDVPGAQVTVAEGINNAGEIGGVYVDAAGNQHGFVLSEGTDTPIDSEDTYTTIDVPGSVATAVNSINEQGQIVGSYDDAKGNTHGYVGTPAR